MMYQEIIKKQQLFFESGATLSVTFRKEQLKKLQHAIQSYTPSIEEAIYKDFKKNNFEVYLSEIAIALLSAKESAKHVESWAKPKSVKSSLLNLPSKDYIIPEPYGSTLIICPWNYPFLLCIDPLIAAISAGNCAVIKPSELTPATSAVIQDMIESIFGNEYVAVFQGDVSVTQQLLDQRFDKIFFTGSTQVGRIVYTAAAKHLTPVTLELGGKSPCIVTKSANLEVAAKRIIWGKMINGGQTCVAPDYLLADRSIKDRLVEELKKTIIAFYGSDAKKSADYPRIINERHFLRLKALLQKDKIAIGGDTDINELYISPTIMDNVHWNDEIMKEEIFGPILPVLTYDSLPEAVVHIKAQEKPLALYLFTEDKKEVKYIQTHCHFGGGCINDTISHLANDRLPFGGVGNSGMGSYHGKFGFDSFSHFKSIVNRGTWLDLKIRYPAYSSKNKKLVQKLIQWL